MPTVEAQIQRFGLEQHGFCTGLSGHAPKWRHEAALLEDLSAQETDTLGALMPKVHASPGQTLIREGDLGDWMLLILAGTVDVCKQTESGEASRLAVLRQGTSIGEMSMLDAAPRYASCIALDDVQAGVLTRATVSQLIHTHPAIGAKLLVKLTQLLAQRLRNTSSQLVKALEKQKQTVA